MQGSSALVETQRQSGAIGDGPWPIWNCHFMGSRETLYALTRVDPGRQNKSERREGHKMKPRTGPTKQCTPFNGLTLALSEPHTESVGIWLQLRS